MANKWVYMFSEGDMTMRNLLGGKGANLAEMTSIGLPVPQGFTITTEACTQYYEDGRKINDEIMAQAMEGVKKMEEINGKKFGDLKNPLLVSVRSGARASMPGMMDTILNLGLNDEVVAAMIAGNPDPAFERFVYDSYRRFIQMFSDVVMEVGKKYFEQLIDKMKEERGVKFDIDLTAADLKELAEQFKAEYKNQLGTDFPSDPVEQLKLAIEAVFRSWDNPRANVYRRDNDIPYSWGTAVNVMPMVFGNLNNESGTGVAFTRDPATGENKLMGEFLINAQGEDVVAGVRTPMPIAQMEQEFPEAYAEFLKVCETLENHYHDMQDMEFTVENKKLYMLQCRNGKRTAPAALKIACDLVDEGHKTEEEAVLMIDPRNLDTLLHPQFDAAALKAATPLGKGLGASPGAACGKVVFTAEDAEEWNARGEKVVLVRLETSPEDITGMKASQGILTVRGGMTSHAAVVARGMGTCCVSGCGDIAMDEENKKFTLAGKEFHEGDYISIDGTTGNIYDGAIKTVDATIAGEFGRVMAWADKYRTLKVRTNADTPADAKKARELGAEGIGLCRTEHMFFEGNRIDAFREMICAETVEEREAALAKILPEQQGDFEKLYEALEGNPVTIRFLDPPLHEFVPQTEEDIKKAILEKTVFGRVTPNQKRQFVQALKEAGKTVAMTGDGVNDVLALKDADCSIAMASGSEAAAQASQIVLLESDFSCMPQVVLEGRRVVNNIQRSASLFLVKNIFSFLLSLFSVVFMFTYPLEPSQVSLISMFTIGIPAFFLALEPNKNIIKGHFLTNVFLKALPAALTDALAVGSLVVFGKTFGVGEQDISTAATMLLAIVGFMILYKISAPMNKLRAGILGGCIAGLLFCSIYLNQLFAITGMTTKCIMLFVVFAIATEPVLRYLTILLGKGRFYYRRLRGKTSLEEEA